MAAMLENRHCDSCGQAHSLWLATADVFDSRLAYKYVCPSTGKSVEFRAEAWTKVMQGRRPSFAVEAHPA